MKKLQLDNIKGLAGVLGVALTLSSANALKIHIPDPVKVNFDLVKLEDGGRVVHVPSVHQVESLSQLPSFKQAFGEKQAGESEAQFAARKQETATRMLQSSGEHGNQLRQAFSEAFASNDSLLRTANQDLDAVAKVVGPDELHSGIQFAAIRTETNDKGLAADNALVAMAVMRQMASSSEGADVLKWVFQDGETEASAKSYHFLTLLSNLIDRERSRGNIAGDGSIKAPDAAIIKELADKARGVADNVGDSDQGRVTLLSEYGDLFIKDVDDVKNGKVADLEVNFKDADGNVSSVKLLQEGSNGQLEISDAAIPRSIAADCSNCVRHELDQFNAAKTDADKKKVISSINAARQAELQVWNEAARRLASNQDPSYHGSKQMEDDMKSLQEAMMEAKFRNNDEMRHMLLSKEQYEKARKDC